MTRTVARTIVGGALSILASVADLAAQSQIPIRQLAPIEATAPDNMGIFGLRVWQWPDGRVVAAPSRQGRLLLFDPMLKSARVLADSTLLASGAASAGLIAFPFGHDTTAVVDAANGAIVLLDDTGKQARVLALPHATDGRTLGAGSFLGNFASFIDTHGRLVYRGSFPPRPAAAPDTPPATVDSFPVVRANFDSRAVDTIAITTSQRGLIPSAMTAPDGKILRKLRVVPNVAIDDWAMLSDGSVAVVRGHDYHIDWVYPDGTRASTPKMQFDWRKLTDADKNRLRDSLTAYYASTDRTMDSLSAARGGTGFAATRPERSYASNDEITEYYPPIRAGSLWADAENRLWILPTTSAQARGGLLYDVVSTAGEIVERVQLPANATVAGFGKGGVVFLRLVRADNTSVLARTHIVR